MLEALMMLVFLSACYCILYRSGLLSDLRTCLWAGALLSLAFLLRWFFLPHQTSDYNGFLARWVEFFRVNGGFKALKYSVGNYNVPYLYFLAAFSYFDYFDLYLIKYLTIAFDILLAWVVMKLSELFRPDRKYSLLAFCVTLLLPTVVLNGAYWGQCDSIYVSLALVSIWCALSDKPKLSLVFISLSLSFKLQAVFFMPVFFVLFVSGRIRWRDMWIVPGTYLLSVLPAVLAGRSLLSTLTLYFDQAYTVGSGLNYNSPSLFAFYSGGGNEALLSKLGIGGAFLFCVVLLGVLTIRKKGHDNKALLLSFALCTICVPLLLPHMHERYFFGADILSFALAFLSIELIPAAILCSLASLISYMPYLWGWVFISLRCGTSCLLVAVLLLLLAFFPTDEKNTILKVKGL